MYILGPNLEPVFEVECDRCKKSRRRNLETVSSEFYDKNWLKKGIQYNEADLYLCFDSIHPRVT